MLLALAACADAAISTPLDADPCLTACGCAAATEAEQALGLTTAELSDRILGPRRTDQGQQAVEVESWQADRWITRFRRARDPEAPGSCEATLVGEGRVRVAVAPGVVLTFDAEVMAEPARLDGADASLLDLRIVGTAPFGDELPVDLPDGVTPSAWMLRDLGPLAVPLDASTDGGLDVQTTRASGSTATEGPTLTVLSW